VLCNISRAQISHDDLVMQALIWLYMVRFQVIWSDSIRGFVIVLSLILITTLQARRILTDSLFINFHIALFLFLDDKTYLSASSFLLL